jgi:glycosyltransferase involved in cell wall biosynthesis
LSELPSPPPGRTGWPWTAESAAAPEGPLEGEPWPRISVVTPCYQHAEFLEETIRSVLLQGYPDLEYIVLDGGSSDGSVEIIQRYEPWLAFWSSGPDSGQASAINVGFGRATGRWRAWLNSDDFYAPGALVRVGAAGEAIPWVVGETGYVDVASRRIGRFPRGYRERSLVGEVGPAWVDVVCASASGTALPQQSSFVSDLAYAAVGGGLDDSLEYLFEHELWVRLARAGFAPTLLPDEFTLYRVHPDQKTRGSTRAATYMEEGAIAGRWLDDCPPESRGMLRSYRRWCVRRALSARLRAAVLGSSAVAAGRRNS